MNKDNRSTLARGFELAREDGSEVVVLHVNLFQNLEEVSRNDLRKEVEQMFDGDLPPNVSYVIREGFLIEESILEVAANEKADVIVIGRSRSGRLRRAMRRLIGNDPDIESFLREKLDVDIQVVG